MNATALRAMLRDCLVQIDDPRPTGKGREALDPGPHAAAGSGFFVAPGYILSCAHVVGREPGDRVCGTWRNRHWSGELVCRSDAPDPDDPAGSGLWPGPDLAIIRLSEAEARSLAHPCVRLASRAPWEGAAMFAIGRRAPFDGRPGDFPSAELRYAGLYTYLMRLTGDRFGDGMSGCPVLDLGRGEVCGVAKLADPATDSYAVPVNCLAELPAGPVRELLRAHDRYHGANPAWTRAQQDLASQSHGPAAAPVAARVLSPAAEAELLGLVAAARDTTPAEALALYRDCAAPGLTPDAGQLPHLRDVAVRLCEQLYQRDTLHPVIVLAERLAARDPALAAGLRDWATAVAEQHGARGLLLSYRAGPRTQRARPSAADPMSAVIQLMPSALAPDHYVFTLWRYRGGDDIQQVIVVNDPLPLDGVIARLRTALGPVLGELDGDPVIVEFVLPAELFDEPIHRWQVFARSFVRLGIRYPVVIRDLERFTDAESRNHARRRWDLLSSGDRTPMHWLDCEEQRGEEELYAWFEGADDIAALGLPGPAARYGAALGAAVYAGMPVAVWSLTPCPGPHDRNGGRASGVSTAEGSTAVREKTAGEMDNCAAEESDGYCAGIRFWQAMTDICETPLFDIPEKLRALRARPGSTLADAALLWDNPYRGPHPRGLAIQQ